jgi:predicted molibdopterin-dependent oxidoreductase YjgC
MFIVFITYLFAWKFYKARNEKPETQIYTPTVHDENMAANFMTSPRNDELTNCPKNIVLFIIEPSRP